MPESAAIAVTDDPTGDRAEVEALVAQAAEADGYSALNEAALLHLRHPRPSVHHLLAHRDGRLVGYAQLEQEDAPGTCELVVGVAERRQGVGAALLDRLLATAGGPVQLWAMRDTPAARALAGHAALHVGRTLLVMERSLAAPLPEPELPEGLVVRTFRVGIDEADWLAVNARAFAQHPEQGRITRADLDERMAEPWFNPAGFLIGERAGRMVGYHWTKQHPGRLGEVYVLGVDPDAAGAGVGRALLLAGLHHLRTDGNEAVELYVEADQQRAVRLYERNRFHTVGRDVLYVSAA